MPGPIRECDLYPPVKAHLESLGYTVRGEVGKCDAVGHDGSVLIAVELKLLLGLAVFYQALERLPYVDFVYVAVAVPDGRKARSNWDASARNAVRMCRMLGLGFLSVRDGVLRVHCDPGRYVPRSQPRKRARLLGEFNGRSGDFNSGGSTRRPRVTAYRERALLCARALAAAGPCSPAVLRRSTGVQDAGAILLDDVYGWFARVARGVYSVNEAGIQALATYADVLAARVRAGSPDGHPLAG